jgi:MFS family permease
MLSSRLKRGYFILEGLNSFGTVLYFYYFYFFMQKEFGYGNKANLALAALNGVTYALGSWWAGRAAQRIGYMPALKVGFGTMALALAIGMYAQGPIPHILVMIMAVLGMCFTWPTLEALVSEGEHPSKVPHMVGVYNVIWAATGAVAYFIGGTLLDQLGLRSIFYVPMGVFLLQFILTVWLERQAKAVKVAVTPTFVPHTAGRPSSVRAKAFLRMAWLANPFAYIAINTVIAVIPGVASRLGLSAGMAGFCCSVWCFARLGAFVGLWLWVDWHYRFVWLLGAFLALVFSFSTILMVPNLIVLVMAQLVFGAAIGLLYSSSLFYSMDLSETKSEHGGVHEAAIGIGNFAGPALGAASLHFLPNYANSGTISVSLLLVCGLGGLVAIWKTAAK